MKEEDKTREKSRFLISENEDFKDTLDFHYKFWQLHKSAM